MTDELGNLARVLSGGQAAGTDPALAAAEALSALRLNSDSDSAVGGSGDKTFVFPDGSEVIMKSQMISSAIIDVLKVFCCNICFIPSHICISHYFLLTGINVMYMNRLPIHRI